MSHVKTSVSMGTIGPDEKDMDYPVNIMFPSLHRITIMYVI